MALHWPIPVRKAQVIIMIINVLQTSSQAYIEKCTHMFYTYVYICMVVGVHKYMFVGIYIYLRNAEICTA